MLKALDNQNISDFIIQEYFEECYGEDIVSISIGNEFFSILRENLDEFNVTHSNQNKLELFDTCDLSITQLGIINEFIRNNFSGISLISYSLLMTNSGPKLFGLKLKSNLFDIAEYHTSTKILKNLKDILSKNS